MLLALTRRQTPARANMQERLSPQRTGKPLDKGGTIYTNKGTSSQIYSTWGAQMASQEEKNTNLSVQNSVACWGGVNGSNPDYTEG